MKMEKFSRMKQKSRPEIRIAVLLIAMLSVSAMSIQGQEYVEFDGYLSDMQSVYKIPDLNWLWENNLHNRLNFHFYPVNWLTGSIQVRNRFITGNTTVKFPGYAEGIQADKGFVDLSFAASGRLNDHSGYIAYSNIDRLWLQFTVGSFEAKIGRQRINWGQTFVWNPNDLFNSYTYFEVDYPERPGSDAVRLQYYPGMTSSIELAAKIDSAEKVTAAAYFRTNALAYDFQFLGGIYNGADLILGTGWSGNLWKIAFRGELSYFRDLANFHDTTGYLITSAGLDYTFSNSLCFRTELLYSAFARDLDITNFMQFYAGDLDVKTLGFTEWAFFFNVSYLFTPLINGGMAAIIYPEWKGFYIGPNLEASITNNMDLSFIFQFFSAEFEVNSITSRENNTLGFLRLKWNF